MPLRGLIHAHSWYSFDSLLPARAYLACARARHLDFLCLTDHGSIAGSQELARRNRDPGLEVVIGAEYATDRGDVIGLFLRREIRARRWVDVVAEIHGQGGLVLLPHPYRHRPPDDGLWPDVDLVEVFNARTSLAGNERAREAAAQHGLPAIAGADTHTALELATNRTLVTIDGQGDLRSRLLAADRDLGAVPAPALVVHYTRVVKAAKRRLPRLPRRAVPSAEP